MLIDSLKIIIVTIVMRAVEIVANAGKIFLFHKWKRTVTSWKEISRWFKNYLQLLLLMFSNFLICYIISNKANPNKRFLLEMH